MMIMEKVDIRQIEAFLYKEARLINSNQLNDWVDLFTKDCHYWIPCNDDDIDPETHVSIIYDDRSRLEERVWRLETGLAYGQQPRSKTRHFISNVEVTGQSKEKVIVTSNVLITELRRGKQTFYSARNEHHLCWEENDWKIKFKKIELLNNDEPLGNLSFIL